AEREPNHLPSDSLPLLGPNAMNVVGWGDIGESTPGALTFTGEVYQPEPTVFTEDIEDLWRLALPSSGQLIVAAVQSFPLARVSLHLFDEGASPLDRAMVPMGPLEAST